jgi:hypothetical protein
MARENRAYTLLDDNDCGRAWRENPSPSRSSALRGQL